MFHSTSCDIAFHAAGPAYANGRNTMEIVERDLAVDLYTTALDLPSATLGTNSWVLVYVGQQTPHLQYALSLQYAF